MFTAGLQRKGANHFGNCIMQQEVHAGAKLSKKPVSLMPLFPKLEEIQVCISVCIQHHLISFMLEQIETIKITYSLLLAPVQWRFCKNTLGTDGTQTSALAPLWQQPHAASPCLTMINNCFMLTWAQIQPQVLQVCTCSTQLLCFSFLFFFFFRIPWDNLIYMLFTLATQHMQMSVWTGVWSYATVPKHLGTHHSAATTVSPELLYYNGSSASKLLEESRVKDAETGPGMNRQDQGCRGRTRDAETWLGMQMHVCWVLVNQAMLEESFCFLCCFCTHFCKRYEEEGQNPPARVSNSLSPCQHFK